MLKPIKIIKLFICGLLMLSGQAFARVILPSVIDNNMVLQQNARVPLWGKTKPNARVTVITSWNNKPYTVWAKTDSTWRVFVQTPKAGGPYEVSFNDGQLLKLKNILIGEVWVCSGQSNMEMPVKGLAINQY